MRVRTGVLLLLGVGGLSAAFLSVAGTRTRAVATIDVKAGEAGMIFPQERSGITILSRAEAEQLGYIIPSPPHDPPAAPSSSQPLAGPVVAQAEPDPVPADDSAEASDWTFIEPPPITDGIGPPIESDCDADFDQSGAVSAADLMSFVTAWFHSTSDGEVSHWIDYNDSGTADVGDVYTFLDFWLRGC